MIFYELFIKTDVLTGRYFHFSSFSLPELVRN